jgi:hypothetical protein
LTPWTERGSSAWASTNTAATRIAVARLPVDDVHPDVEALIVGLRADTPADVGSPALTVR